MDAFQRFQEACKAPVDIDECRKALQRMIDGTHTLHIPPQINDEDILLARALDELERLRGEQNAQRPDNRST